MMEKRKNPNTISHGLSLSDWVWSGPENLVVLQTWEPTKRAIGSRIAIHDRLKGEVVSVARLAGSITWQKKGKARILGELALDQIEAARGNEGTTWFFKDVNVLAKPVPHHGGLSLWKVKEDLAQVLEEAVRESTALKALEEIEPAPEGTLFDPEPESEDAETYELGPLPEGFYDPVTGEVYEPLPPAKEEGEAVLDIPWKNKKQFHGESCAVQNCTSPADGFMSVIFPKVGLRYRPICVKCSIKYSTHKPTPLQELARQRKGLADLALILDSTPDLVWALLEEAGITERGERKVPMCEKPLELVSQAQSAESAPLCADCGEPQFNTPSGLTCKNGHGGAPSIVDSKDAKVKEATIALVIPREKIEAVKAEAEEALKQLQGFVIRDQQGMDIATSITQAVKTQYKELETLRKKTVKPINEAKATAQDAFNPALNALVAIENFLKARIAEAYRRIQAEQDRALQTVQVAYQQGDARTAALATQQAQAAEISMSKGASIRPRIGYIVQNIELVPRQFLMVNDAAVIAALEAGYQIPGIEKTVTDSVTVRS